MKKDPGIPNAFPFKDQIIGEIEEARKNVRRSTQFRSPMMTNNAYYRAQLKKSDDRSSRRP